MVLRAGHVAGETPRAAAPAKRCEPCAAPKLIPAGVDSGEGDRGSEKKTRPGRNCRGVGVWTKRLDQMSGVRFDRARQRGDSAPRNGAAGSIAAAALTAVIAICRLRRLVSRPVSRFVSVPAVVRLRVHRVRRVAGHPAMRVRGHTGVARYRESQRQDEYDGQLPVLHCVMHLLKRTYLNPPVYSTPMRAGKPCNPRRASRLAERGTLACVDCRRACVQRLGGPGSDWRRARESVFAGCPGGRRGFERCARARLAGRGKVYPGRKIGAFGGTLWRASEGCFRQARQERWLSG